MGRLLTVDMKGQIDGKTVLRPCPLQSSLHYLQSRPAASICGIDDQASDLCFWVRMQEMTPKDMHPTQQGRTGLLGHKDGMILVPHQHAESLLDVLLRGCIAKLVT